MSEDKIENQQELSDNIPEDILDWLGTLAQVHRSKAVHSNCEDKIYTQADMEADRAGIFDIVIKFLANHTTFGIQAFTDTGCTEIIPELNNLVFNKVELEDIIILQPISDDITAQTLQDVVNNIDSLRDAGYFSDKTVMVLDSQIRVIRAKLGVAVEPSSEG